MRLVVDAVVEIRVEMVVVAKEEVPVIEVIPVTERLVVEAFVANIFLQKSEGEPKSYVLFVVGV